MPRRLVIVESPTKAKTLKRFLGDDFIVESSIGHIRDLPASASEIPAAMKSEAWARLGVNVEDDFKPLYVVSTEKKQKIAELKKLMKGVDELLLATDEDREGEAISWHLVEVLKPKVPIKRMVFHEITKAAILESLEQTREIDTDLVGAQETRRIIDRLYGYEVSPILWRKIAPRLSAGRVQSVAIRMLVEREQARMRFVVARYWDLVATFQTPAGEDFPARLSHLDKKRIASGKDFDPDTGKLKRDDLALVDAEEAEALGKALDGAAFTILGAEEKPFARSPAPPFTTSTLQQESNRKLRFDARRTMRAAQRLYENGFITYMRTDSVALSGEGLRGARKGIQALYGDQYLLDEPRVYKSKVKNAQEAHEAIRPAGEAFASVEHVSSALGGDEARIYELIWKRTMACQMPNSRGRRMTLRVGGDADGREAVFVANGSVIDFPGFLRAYVEGRTEQAADALKDTLLPHVNEGDGVTAVKLDSEEHATIPPARLSEAALVKALEESGVGRPSTYASIIDTIQRREYSFKKGTALVPTFVAFAVVALMTEHLTDLIDYEFTARMEDKLDEISRGEYGTLPYLKEFYFGNGQHGLRPLLDRKAEDIDPRKVCTIPLNDEIAVRVGRYGPYLQRGETTAPIPDGTCPDELTIPVAMELLEAGARADTPIGNDPETSLPIYIKTGRFGPYVQLGVPDPDDKKKKPKMVSLQRGMTPDEMTLELALKLLSLPRNLGQDENGVDIIAQTGRYGPYIKRGEDTRSLEPEDDVLEVGLARALELLKKEKSYRRGRATHQVFEGVDALDGATLKIMDGRYGPYVSDGEYNASLPKAADPLQFTLQEAVELIEKKRAQGPPKKRAKRKAKKTTAKKKATKKKTAKKKATKKT